MSGVSMTMAAVRVAAVPPEPAAASSAGRAEAVTAPTQAAPAFNPMATPVPKVYRPAKSQAPPWTPPGEAADPTAEAAPDPAPNAILAAQAYGRSQARMSAGRRSPPDLDVRA